ncbi:MAG: hypothetical protein LBM60_05265 [Clostridium sp.]|jgi:hypothetical protein|nr:hypothetical protein [Clostridium sp.]
MTVEAAIIMPLILFFFLNLGSAIEMMRFHGHMQMALWETGNHLTMYGYAYDVVMDGVFHYDTSEDGIIQTLAGVAFSQTYAKAQVTDYLENSYAGQASPGSFILRGGVKSLNFLESSLMGSDQCIDLMVTYPVQTMFSIVGIGSFRMSNRYYGRAWTGYDGEFDGSQSTVYTDFVYVTEHGTVYHEIRDCTHINLSVRSVTLAEAKSSYNEYGSSYKECSLCQDLPVQSIVFLTDNGTSYHYSANCSGIKRAVHAIQRTDATGYRPCSRCATPGGDS